jgi:CheY-like chemotaxis protein
VSRPLSILVVDDNASMTIALQDILDIKGFDVYSALSGADALDILRDHPVDILLTDVKMPDMDGVVLFRKAREIHQDIITFIMTAYAADELIQKGISEGVKAVMTKPVDIDLFLSMLSAIAQMYNQPARPRPGHEAAT